VSAVLAGPGALLARLGFTRLGDWLRATTAMVFPSEADDPVRVPFGRVADIGDHLTLSLDHDDVATHAVERWVCDHLIDHIPGSSHAAPE
jgi:hypothetical protein